MKLKGDPLETKNVEKKSHSAEKTKGGPFTLTRFCRLRLKSKKPKGPFEDKKNFEKSRTRPKKIERDDPLVSSGFLGYV